jgi:hypothetical protein
MTVKELIEELNKMPQDKIVEMATLSQCIGEVKRVSDYKDYVELESNLA